MFLVGQVLKRECVAWTFSSYTQTHTQTAAGLSALFLDAWREECRKQEWRAIEEEMCSTSFSVSVNINLVFYGSDLFTFIYLATKILYVTNAMVMFCL